MTEEVVTTPKRTQVPECPKTPPATPQKCVISKPQFRAGRQSKTSPKKSTFYQFEKQGPVTIKMTDGSQVITEGFMGAPGYRDTKALGYLMRVHGGHWVACVGKRRSEPLALSKAKEVARQIDRDGSLGTAPLDPVQALNETVANLIDREDTEARRKEWPVELMGGGRRNTNKCLAAHDKIVLHKIIDAEAA
jgi:hypothetical protein